MRATLPEREEATGRKGRLQGSHGGPAGCTEDHSGPEAKNRRPPDARGVPYPSA